MSEAKITLTAVDKTAGAFASIKSNLQGIGSQAASVGAALSGVGATGALVGLAALVRSSANAVDAFNDLSDATGASIENISALDRIARETGSSYEAVASMLVRFNKVLNDAGEAGSEAGRVLQALGLDAQTLKDIDPAEALRQAAVALNGFAADGNKARAIQILFGKSVQEAAPLLKDLAAQTQLVGTTSTKAAEEAEVFNKALASMRANSEDLVRSLANRVIPLFNQLFRDISEFGSKAALAGLASDVIKADRELKALQSRSGGPFNFAGNLNADIEAASKRLEAAKAAFRAADVNRAPDAFQALEDRRLAGRPLPSLAVPAKPAPAGAAKIDDSAQSLASYVTGLQGALDKTRELTEVERARQFLLSLGRTGEIDQVRTLVLGLAEQVDAEKDSTQALKDKRAAAAAAGDALTKANEEYQALVKSLLDATPTAKLEAQRKAMQALAEEFQAGRISAQQFNEAATAYLNLDPAKDPALDNLKEITAAIEAMGNRAADVFTEMAMTGKISFKGMADSIIADILRIQIRQNITQPLTQAVQGMDFKAMFGFASGGVMTGDGPLPLRKYASGGIANSPQLAMFGEGSMPEAYVPLPDGRRIPVAMQGPASAPVVNLSYTFNGPADATQVLTAAQLGAAMAESKIRDSMQRGRM